MSKLLDLPAELLHDIVGRCERKDLRSLCLVCSHAREIASPRLYQDVSLSCSERLPQVPPLFLFLRTIFHHPTRTSLVRRMRITGTSSGTNGQHAASLWSQDLPLVQRLTSPAEFAETSPRINDYLISQGPGYLDYMVAILLMTLPTLRSARLNVAFATLVGWTEMVVTKRLFELCSQPHPLYRWACLQDLEEIDYYVNISKVLGSLLQPVNLLLWLFWQPKMRSIRIRVVEDDNHLWERLSSPPQPHQPGLTSLSLIDSCLRLDSLEQLLRCTPNLRRLKYQHACDIETSLDECRFLDCVRLGHILGESCASLEDLSLSIFFYFYTRRPLYQRIYSSDSSGIRGSLGSMKHFSRLKHLQVPLAMLLGWWAPPYPILNHRLPEGLLDLCLTSDLLFPDENEWYVGEIMVQMWPMILNDGIRRYLPRISFRSLTNEPRWSDALQEAVQRACNGDSSISFHVEDIMDIPV
ncbi:MAG: hypothetical protein Q9223_001818 [Gallowayella weberi]